MKLSSPAFNSHAPVPARYTGVGNDVSPPLAWEDVPVGTKSFALICDDPDAPSRARPRPEGPWVHWVIYNIPADAREIPEGISRVPSPVEVSGSSQGCNDFRTDNSGYRGPMPPPGSGPHRYFFRLYALDDLLDLPVAEASKVALLAAMKSHVLAEAELVGTFERQAT